MPAGPSATPPGGTPTSRHPTSAAATGSAGSVPATDKQEQPGQGEAHADGERERLGMAVGVEADERLQQRGGQLEGERDEADLGEGEAERLLQQRVDRRDERLDQCR